MDESETTHETDGRIGHESPEDYLALTDVEGPSGVWFGGIGTGAFVIAPNGQFTRIACNNWHKVTPADRETHGIEPEATFLALYDEGESRVLHRGPDRYGLDAVSETSYRGLFPTAEIDYGTPTDGVFVTASAYSALVPQDVGDSSLPLGWVEVEVENPTDDARTVATALSWEDVLGRGITDAKPDRLDDIAEAHTEGHPGFPDDAMTELDPIPTRAEKFETGGYAGVRQTVTEPIEPRKYTFQHYTTDVGILAEERDDAEISVLPGYALEDGDAWERFRETGTFESDDDAVALSDLDPGPDPNSAPDGKQGASAVAIRTELAPGESKTLRFLVSWFAEPFDLDRGSLRPGRYWRDTDYNHYYHNDFDSLDEIVEYAAEERERLHAETTAWHEPILESSYPDWLKFKVINDAAVIYSLTVLNRDGDFTVMEGAMYGAMGTMDQRISAHPFYQALYPDLDSSEMALFAEEPGERGQIHHFCGNFYVGATSDGKKPAHGGWMIDNTGGWLLQLAEDYQQTGDASVVTEYGDEIRDAVAFLREEHASPDLPIAVGPSTYDDFWLPEANSYLALSYPVYLQAGAVLAEVLGDDDLRAYCERQAEASRRAAIEAFWNGRFFSYGLTETGEYPDPPESVEPLDAVDGETVMFSGQLAGQFLSRYLGWGDVVPVEMARASFVAQAKTNLLHAHEYYGEPYFAPKVWNAREQEAMTYHGNRSTCWPFYLQSYTALAAVQAGYVEDGLSILEHVQRLQVARGFKWMQNLWEPAPMAYMTAPVSWFVTDVLAGSALDVPGGTLHLSPVLREGETVATRPIYKPRFWATVEADSEAETLTLTVERTFGDPVEIDEIAVQPAGVPADEGSPVALDSPVELAEGSTVDLSEHWGEIVRHRSHDPVLEPAPPSDAEYIEVDVPEFLDRPDLQVSSGGLTVADPGHRAPFVDEATVELAADEGDVYYTTDGSDPRDGGTGYDGPFTVTESVEVQARATRDDRWSAPVVCELAESAPATPNADAPDADARGADAPDADESDADTPDALTFEYYEGEAFDVQAAVRAWGDPEFPDFDELTPVETGGAAAISLDVARRDEEFGVVFEGTLSVPERGLYEVTIDPDGRARLELAGTVLETAGLGGNRNPETVQLPLDVGNYQLRIEYVNPTGDADLRVTWDGPSVESASTRTRP